MRPACLLPSARHAQTLMSQRAQFVLVMLAAAVLIWIAALMSGCSLLQAARSHARNMDKVGKLADTAADQLVVLMTWTSQIQQNVNQLIWDLRAKFNALVVFIVLSNIAQIAALIGYNRWKTKRIDKHIQDELSKRRRRDTLND